MLSAMYEPMEVSNMVYLVNLHATSSVTKVSMTEPGRLGFSALHQSEVSIEVM